jgi:hypothetical protein
MSLLVPPAKSVVLWLAQEMETKWKLSKSLSANRLYNFLSIESFCEILSMLLIASGHDFSLVSQVNVWYKSELICKV